MRVRFRLSDGEVLEINDIEDDWEEKLAIAHQASSFFDIHGSDGHVIGVNPQHIMYWECQP